MASPDEASANTRDLAIWATLQPMVAAASCAVRVDPGSSLTSQGNQRVERKVCTRRALSWRCDVI